MMEASQFLPASLVELWHTLNPHEMTGLQNFGATKNTNCCAVLLKYVILFH